MFEVKFCVVGWMAIGLVVCGGLGSTLDVLKRKPPDKFISIALIEVVGLLVAAGSKVVPVKTEHAGVISGRSVE